MGIIATTLFLRTNMRRDNLTDGRIFTGSLFFVTVTVMFSGMTKIVMGILRLPVFYKQRNLLFYWILSVPVNVVEIRSDSPRKMTITFDINIITFY
ncbi:hypothetical protein ACS0TY_013343 [Phlomoides rotata]